MLLAVHTEEPAHKKWFVQTGIVARMTAVVQDTVGLPALLRQGVVPAVAVHMNISVHMSVTVVVNSVAHMMVFLDIVAHLVPPHMGAVVSLAAVRTTAVVRMAVSAHL